jgi:hypothetical protein
MIAPSVDNGKGLFCDTARLTVSRDIAAQKCPFVAAIHSFVSRFTPSLNES